MVKAKDLIDKSPEDFEEDPLDKKAPKSQDEDERVNEAYENITKKLEALREGDKKEEMEDEEREEEEEDKEELEEKDEEEKEDEEIEQSFKEEPIDEEESQPRETFKKEMEDEKEDPLDKDEELSAEDVKKLNEKEEGAKESKIEEGEVETLDDIVEEDMHIPPLKSQVPQTGIYSQQNRGEFHNEERRHHINERPVFSNRLAHPQRSGSKLHLIILFLIGLAVIGGTVYLLKNQFNGPAPTPTPEATAVPTVAPTPTPEPVERSNFKVRVLNGTTKSGLAGTVLAKLKELGYKSDRAGNATNSAFERTVIRVKENEQSSSSNNASLSGQLTADLKPDYDAEIENTLKASDTVDAEIILGAK